MIPYIFHYTYSNSCTTFFPNPHTLQFCLAKLIIAEYKTLRHMSVQNASFIIIYRAFVRGRESRLNIASIIYNMPRVYYHVDNIPASPQDMVCRLRTIFL